MKQVIFKSALLIFGFMLFFSNNAQGQYWNTTGNVVTAGQILGSTNPQALDIRTSNATRMFITSNGNIGIGTGTTTPSQRLQLKGGNLLLDYASGTSTGNLFLGDVTTSSKNGLRLSYANGTYKSAYLDVRTDDPTKGLIFRIDGGIGSTERMRICANGKVLIGIPSTNMPGNYNLYVKNGILTEMVKVALYGTANWADYVFAPDYKLKPLHEVEAFVKEHKHLPNVPSAQEIVDNGLDLAQMQAKQMEKIEELTLYLIEMKKEIEALKSENVSLKAPISNK